MMFPEDDELDPKEELDRIDRNMSELASRRQYMQEKMKSQRLKPQVEKISDLAQEAGHLRGVVEGLSNRCNHLERRIKVRDELIEEREDYDIWKQRALDAEAKLKRRRKR